MAYPIFVITEETNQAITATAITGLRITISEFRLGSDFDTPATPLDNDLKGNLVYSGIPASYFYYDKDTVGIRLEIPPDVGPFRFGEIGLFTDTGRMFARASLGALQDKFGPAGGGMPNIWKITALLRFGQAPAYVNVVTSMSSTLFEVSDFSLLSPPGLMPSGQNAVIVHEPSPADESVLVYSHSPTHWTINGYEKIGYITLSAPSSPSDIPSLDWANYLLNDYQVGKYIVQTLQGDIRSIESVDATVAHPTQSMPILPAGAVLELYGALDQSGIHTSLPAQQFNDMVTEFNQYWGAPTGTSVVDAKGINQPPVPQSLNPNQVSSAEWYLFLDALRDYARLYGVNPSVDIRQLTGDWSTNYFQQFRIYNGVCDILNRISQKKPGEVPMSSTDSLNQVTISRDTPWSDIQWDLQLTWPSVAMMQAFFNAGGWVGFKADLTSNNYVQAVQEKILSNLGMIRLCGYKSESTGSMKIEWENGDGELTDFGNCGFLGLSNGDKTIWSYAAVAATSAGKQSQEGVVTFQIQASRSGPNLMVRFRVQDTSLDEFINDSKGGVPRFDMTLVTGRPSSGIISDNPIPHPTFTQLPSTNW